LFKNTVTALTYNRALSAANHVVENVKHRGALLSGYKPL